MRFSFPCSAEFFSFLLPLVSLFLFFSIFCSYFFRVLVHEVSFVSNVPAVDARNVHIFWSDVMCSTSLFLPSGRAYYTQYLDRPVCHSLLLLLIFSVDGHVLSGNLRMCQTILSLSNSYRQSLMSLNVMRQSYTVILVSPIEVRTQGQKCHAILRPARRVVPARRAAPAN